MRKHTAKNHCYVIWCFSASSIGQISVIFLSYTPLSPEPTTKKHFSITFLPFSALFGTFLLRFTRFAIRSSACNTFHFRFHSVYFRYSSNFRCVCFFFSFDFSSMQRDKFFVQTTQIWLYTRSDRLWLFCSLAEYEKWFNNIIVCKKKKKCLALMKYRANHTWRDPTLDLLIERSALKRFRVNEV